MMTLPMACGVCGEEKHLVESVMADIVVKAIVLRCCSCSQETRIVPSSQILFKVDPNSEGMIAPKYKERR